MRLRTLLIGFLALIFAGSAAVGVYLLGAPSSGSSAPELTSIVAAKIDVPRGATLTAEQVHLIPWPKAYLPVGAVHRIEDAVDRAVSIPLAKNETVTEAKLAAKGAGRGLAALVPPGMRAMTILTPNVSTGVAGFVLPGNQVDVLLTLSRVGLDDKTGGGGTIPLLQNIEILAVDQRIEVPSENWVDPKELRSVTLLVTPKQATQLDLGQNKGTLSLALRNPSDDQHADIEPTTLAGLRMYHSSSVREVFPADLGNEPQSKPAAAESSAELPWPAAVAEVEPTETEPTETEFVSTLPIESDAENAERKPRRKPAYLRVRTLRGLAGSTMYLPNDELRSHSR